MISDREILPLPVVMTVSPVRLNMVAAEKAPLPPLALVLKVP